MKTAILQPIVGAYLDTDIHYHGFIYNRGNFTTIDGIPWGINDRGQVIEAGSIYYQGRYTPIAVPGADSTEAHSINNSGQIAGGYGAEGFGHAFIGNPITGGGSASAMADLIPAPAIAPQSAQQIPASALPDAVGAVSVMANPEPTTMQFLPSVGG